MKTFFNTLVVALLPVFVSGQMVNNADFIAPMDDGFAAVKIEEKWGFINDKGQLAVKLRDDLIFNENVTTAVDLGVASFQYPLMIEDRAIVKTTKDGINYYGFINSEGKLVIDYKFLNVSNFKEGYALALMLSEEILGENKPLGKRVVRYYYDLVLIDLEGHIAKYLCGPFPLTLAKEKLEKAPPIVAKDLSPYLIAVKTPGDKWEVIQID